MERPKTNLMDRPRTNLMDRPSTRQILGSARSGMPPLNFKTIKFLNNEEAIEVIHFCFNIIVFLVFIFKIFEYFHIENGFLRNKIL